MFPFLEDVAPVSGITHHSGQCRQAKDQDIFAMKADRGSLVTLAMFHHQIDSLEQIDVTQNVAFDRDDVGKFSFTD